MTNGIAPGPLGIGNTYKNYIDTGMSCKAGSTLPGTLGILPIYSDAKAKQTLYGNAYLFVLADEVLPSGKIVRKVIKIPTNSTASMVAAYPEIFGLQPKNMNSTLTIGEHALGDTNSRYTSASNKNTKIKLVGNQAYGAPNMEGRPVWIDIKKAQAAGATIHSTEEIIADLDRLANEQPHLRQRINKLKSVISSVEGEVLIAGNVPKTAIKSQSAMQATKVVRFVQVVGITFAIYDMTNATVKSVNQGSAKPIVAETVRQVGGWGGAWLGAKFGGMAGAAVTSETGPGAIIGGAVGALIFGTAGYFGFDWVADHIDEN